MCVCVCVCVCVCANSLAKPHVSATGTGGTSGAHTHKLRGVASTPASY